MARLSLAVLAISAGVFLKAPATQRPWSSFEGPAELSAFCMKADTGNSRSGGKRSCLFARHRGITRALAGLPGFCSHQEHKRSSLFKGANIMNRRDVLKSSVLGASALAVGQSFAQPAGASQETASHIWPNVPVELNGGRMPNVLWICPDMQRFDTIEGLNNDMIHTPNIRKRMSDSVTFTHA
jgi:hypothetical protein